MVWIFKYIYIDFAGNLKENIAKIVRNNEENIQWDF